MDYIKWAFDRFYSKYHYERIPVEIIFTDDIHSTYIELETNEILKKARIKDEELKKNAAGTIVLPKNIGDTAYILVERYYEDSPPIIPTVVHELVHIHDAIDFAKFFCSSVVHDVTKHELAVGEHIWTEFHASYIGEDVFYDYLFETEEEPEYIFEEIEESVKIESNQVEEQVFKKKDHAATYLISIFLGKIYNFEKRTNGRITLLNAMSYKMMIRLQAMFKLYEILTSNLDFESAKENFQLLMDLQELLVNPNQVI